MSQKMKLTQEACEPDAFTNEQDWVKNEDGTYSYDGNVYINKKHVENGRLKYKFKRVTGCFSACGVGLVTLEGCPEFVGGIFSCADNKLVSLVGGPKEVRGNYYCDGNELKTLEGCPDIVFDLFSCCNNKLGPEITGAPDNVRGDFYCRNNGIVSLKGMPKIVNWDKTVTVDLSCNNLKDLTGFNCDIFDGQIRILVNFNDLDSLEGCPDRVYDFTCSNCNLKTLKGSPKIVEANFCCSENQLTTLEGAPEIVKGDFFCCYNNLVSLAGGPRIVVQNYDCSENNIDLTKALPDAVGGVFIMSIKSELRDKLLNK